MAKMRLSEVYEYVEKQLLAGCSLDVICRHLFANEINCFSVRDRAGKVSQEAVCWGPRESNKHSHRLSKLTIEGKPPTIYKKIFTYDQLVKLNEKEGKDDQP